MAGWMAHDSGHDRRAAQHFARALPLGHVLSRDHQRQRFDLRPEHGRGTVLPSPAVITRVGSVTAGSALSHARVSFPASA
ncbi:hypothetical protein J2Z21_009727 [Streptomyces griseochromogenes]|uniref:Uncharacterized protein n=1 Tax=Streptomyces griseochromogenes TaxID=68214 RepID=A0ABS4MAL9_9ACTN|nr:hypothetical protein [Streptomyces griseochromogenes]